MSQLDLAVAGGVSSGHVRFLEPGRSRRSQEMILRIAATLDVPLRDQNELLRAAGLEEVFPEPGGDAPLPATVERAIERMMSQHEPFPLVVFDRRSHLLRTNQGPARLLPHLAPPPPA